MSILFQAVRTTCNYHISIQMCERGIDGTKLRKSVLKSWSAVRLCRPSLGIRARRCRRCRVCRKKIHSHISHISHCKESRCCSRCRLFPGAKSTPFLNVQLGVCHTVVARRLCASTLGRWYIVCSTHRSSHRRLRPLRLLQGVWSKMEVLHYRVPPVQYTGSLVETLGFNTKLSRLCVTQSQERSWS